MLTATDLTQLCQRLQLSAQAIAVIDSIRASPPSRRVRSAVGNVSVRYPSRKMGVIIQAESHRNELAGVYEKEHDPATLEYYDQPSSIRLVYQARSNRTVSVLHTPDFFVIRSDSVGWEEWKMEEELAQLTQKMPQRYQRAEDGHWHCPPGECYATTLGFFYRIRSSAEINWVFQRNLLFLEDYLRSDCPSVSEPDADAVLALVADQPGLSLDALLRQVGATGSDTVYTLIATERLYVDLQVAALAEPTQVPVFHDGDTARAHAVMTAVAQPSSPDGSSIPLAPGSPVIWDGQRWKLLNDGETTMALLNESGTLVELPRATFEALRQQGKLTGVSEPPVGGLSPAGRERLSQASPDDLREGNRRYAILAPRLAGGPPVPGATPSRTVRYWLARWRQADQAHGCGYIGLLPRRGQSGNRHRKLPAATLSLLDEFIRSDYETLKQKPRFEAYAALVRACDTQGLTPPSYKTFATAVHNRPQTVQVEKRQGHRAAYQMSAFYWELTPTTPRHGDRPFDIGHVDHTQLDVELVCSRTGTPLGRPWATFLVDAYSRRILAVYLTFDSPSYRSTMMVLRECVRRHHRLPQTMVVDGGAEFESIYFETLLARYECAKKTRPAARPRFGSVCERLFGTTNTRFVHNLTGNTQGRQHPRQVTHSVDPKAHACWTLGRLYGRLCEWAYVVYDTLDHPALGQTPAAAFVDGLARSGLRPQRHIAYDEDFRLFTLPTTRKGTAKLQPRLGVKLNHVYYWADAFTDPEVGGTQVAVRYDPFDAGLAYAFVKGHWTRCVSEHHARLAGRSERELQLASAELHRRQQRHGQTLTVTARRLADFLVSLEAEEVLLTQRLRDAEARQVLRSQMPDQPGETSMLGDSPPTTVTPPDGEPPTGTGAGVLRLYEDY